MLFAIDRNMHSRRKNSYSLYFSEKKLANWPDSAYGVLQVSAPPAEREASGSPPEGGGHIGKAPLGLN